MSCPEREFREWILVTFEERAPAVLEYWELAVRWAAIEEKFEELVLEQFPLDQTQ
jgi:hypothetical protein